MEAVLTKPKQKYHFTRKMTDEEIRELIDNYDYTEEDEDDNGAIWDRFGNPTESTIRAKYEVEHGLTSGPMTLEELAADWAKMLEEIDDEESRSMQQIPA